MIGFEKDKHIVCAFCAEWNDIRQESQKSVLFESLKFINTIF